MYIKNRTASRLAARLCAQRASDAALLAARTAREQWREPPPFCFERLSLVESREKDNYEPHRGIDLGAAL